MIDIQKIISVVLIKPIERQHEDINLLVELTKDIQFFKDYIDQKKEDVHRKCCQYMFLEEHQEKSTVFNIGSIGKKFYIILEGEVGVYIRKQQAPSESIAESPQKAKNCFQRVTKLIKATKFKTEKQENQEKHIIQQSSPVISLEQQIQVPVLDIEKDLFCISTLKYGQQFGELALISDKPRLATIICNNRCKFAVLDKQNFQKILKEQEELKLMRALRLYSSIPMFENLSLFLLKQVHWISFRVQFKKNEKVFEYGDESDAMYIVNSGAFLIFLKFDQAIQTDQEEEERDNLKAEEATFTLKEKRGASTASFVEGTDIKIALMLPHQVIGEDDLFEGKRRKYNFICVSEVGELIRIKTKDFKHKIINDEGVRKYLKTSIPLKQKQITQIILQKKNTLLSNYRYLTQIRQEESMQTQIDSGKLDVTRFLENKISVPISQTQHLYYPQEQCPNTLTISGEVNSTYNTSLSRVPPQQEKQLMTMKIENKTDKLLQYQINTCDPLLRGICTFEKKEYQRNHTQKQDFQCFFRIENDLQTRVKNRLKQRSHNSSQNERDSSHSKFMTHRNNSQVKSIEKPSVPELNSKLLNDFSVSLLFNQNDIQRDKHPIVTSRNTIAFKMANFLSIKSSNQLNLEKNIFSPYFVKQKRSTFNSIENTQKTNFSDISPARSSSRNVQSIFSQRRLHSQKKQPMLSISSSEKLAQVNKKFLENIKIVSSFLPSEDNDEFDKRPTQTAFFLKKSLRIPSKLSTQETCKSSHFQSILSPHKESDDEPFQQSTKIVKSVQQSITTTSSSDKIMSRRSFPSNFFSSILLSKRNEQLSPGKQYQSPIKNKSQSSQIFSHNHCKHNSLGLI